MKIEIFDKVYRLKFDYDPRIIAWIKDCMAGPRYEPANRTWTVTRCYYNAVQLLERYGIQDDEMLSCTPTQALTFSGPAVTLNARLLSHQRDWESKAVAQRCLLKADMGMGKTLMALQWLRKHNVPEKHVLVVCPNHLVYSWASEFKKFSDWDPTILQGTAARRHALAEVEGVHVVNYEFFASNEALRKKMAGKRAVICDECHKLKGPSAKRSRAMHEFCKGDKMVLLLTGTPVSQGPQDYYSQMKVLDPKLAGPSFTAFKHRYCIEEQIRGAPLGAKRIVGYKNLDELMRRLKSWMTVYNKQDWLDLPAKSYVTRFVDLTPTMRRHYATLKRDAVLALDEATVVTANVLTKLLRLSQLTQGFVTEDGKTIEFDNPKLAALEGIVEEFEPGEPFVVMCRFLHDIDAVSGLLASMGITHARIQGSVSNEDRHKAEQDLRAGKIRAIVGQIRVAGTGLNLEAASKMVFFSNEYSLNDRLQAEDRIHRVTSTKPCVYIDLCAKETIDEHVTEALQRKQDVVNNLEMIRKSVDN